MPKKDRKKVKDIALVKKMLLDVPESSSSCRTFPWGRNPFVPRRTSHNEKGGVLTLSSAVLERWRSYEENPFLLLSFDPLHCAESLTPRTATSSRARLLEGGPLLRRKTAVTAWRSDAQTHGRDGRPCCMHCKTENAKDYSGATPAFVEALEQHAKLPKLRAAWL